MHRKVPVRFILMELEKETPVYHTRHQSQTTITVRREARAMPPLTWEGERCAPRATGVLH
jgi:hypothetical protein